MNTHNLRPSHRPDTIPDIAIDQDQEGETIGREQLALPDGSAVEEAYRLTTGEAIAVPPTDSEGTLANAIASEEHTVAVTFSSACAEQFPSVQHLAPGHSILEQLITTLITESDTAERLSKRKEARADSDVPLVCGWGRDDTLGTLLPTGEVAENPDRAVLSSWHDTLVADRDRL
jgi:hypothetical protein